MRKLGSVFGDAQVGHYVGTYHVAFTSLRVGERVVEHCQYLLLLLTRTNLNATCNLFRHEGVQVEISFNTRVFTQGK